MHRMRGGLLERWFSSTSDESITSDVEYSRIRFIDTITAQHQVFEEFVWMVVVEDRLSSSFNATPTSEIALT